MKFKLCLILVFFVCFGTNAQDDFTRTEIFEEARDEAEEQTILMKEALNLTDEQVQEISSINYFHGKELKLACKEMSGEEVAAKFDRLQHSREEAIKKVLDENQYKVYTELRNRSEWSNLNLFKYSEGDLGQDVHLTDTLAYLHYSDACVKDSTQQENQELKARKNNSEAYSIQKDNEQEEEEGISLRKRRKSFSYSMPEEGFDNKSYAKALKEEKSVRDNNNDSDQEEEL